MQQVYLYLVLEGRRKREDSLLIGEACEAASYYREFEVTDVREEETDFGWVTKVWFIFSAEEDCDLGAWFKKMQNFGKSLARRLGLSSRRVLVRFAESRWNVYEFNRVWL